MTIHAFEGTASYVKWRAAFACKGCGLAEDAFIHRALAEEPLRRKLLVMGLTRHMRES